MPRRHARARCSLCNGKREVFEGAIGQDGGPVWKRMIRCPRCTPDPHGVPGQLALPGLE